MVFRRRDYKTIVLKNGPALAERVLSRVALIPSIKCRVAASAISVFSTEVSHGERVKSGSLGDPRGIK